MVTARAVQRIPILAYHKIDIVKELSITCISPKNFGKQIRFLAECGYQSISPEIVTAAACGEVKLPPNPILLTFDDGYENFYNYAYPVMKKYGYTATIFLIASYIELPNFWDVKLGRRRFKHLTRAQIQELSQEGFCFGSHGVNHLFLTRQNDSTAKFELQASKSILENLLQKPVHLFSYPYGDYDSRIIQFVKECGYMAAFSLRPRNIITDDNLYFLPRVAIYRCDTMLSFKAKLGLMGNACFHFEQAKNFIVNKCAYANLLRYTKFWRIIHNCGLSFSRFCV